MFPKYQNDVVRLLEKTKLVVPQNDPIDDIKRKLEFQPKLFFLGLLNDQVIGSIMIGYNGHRGWSNYLAVSPEYQRQGYGKELVEKAIYELRQLGCVKINLQVRNSNASSFHHVQSYAKMICFSHHMHRSG